MSNIKPQHYKAGDMDVIAFCQHHELDFCSGNIVKYIVRAGRKSKTTEIEDIDKAREYLDRLRQDVLAKQQALIHP